MQPTILLLLLATAFTPRPAAAPVVVAVATDYHLALPARLAAGPTTFRLVNRGREVHHLYLVELHQGKTAADLLQALRAGGPPPAWAVDDGGPNATPPGSTSALTTVTLRPGRYAALCVIPGPDGKPHVMKGMITELTVTPAAAGGSAQSAPPPPPDLGVGMTEYGFALPATLPAGEHRIRVSNDGKQSHELVLVRLAPGRTVADVEAWAVKMAGPPPATFLGGVSPLAPGRENILDVNLTAGKYALLCFVPDAGDGKPHFAHGMAQEITVD